MNEIDEFLRVGIAAAQAGGVVLREHYGKALRVDSQTRHDMKLEVDRLCDEAVCKTIRCAFPGHAILTEESGETQGQLGNAAAFRWIVDPLDGTVNYFHAIPHYCTSVALYRHPNAPNAGSALSSLGEPVLGIVLAPALNELFVAVKGRGANVNNVPLQTVPTEKLCDAVVCAAYGSSPESRAFMSQCTPKILERAQKLRCYGASALDLAYTAAGRFGAVYHRELKTWDIAAGRILIEEAGGRFEAVNFGPDTWEMFAAGAGIFDELQALVRSI